MAVVGVALLALGMLLGALGHNLDPATTGELGVLQWFHEHRNGFLTVLAKAIELVMGPKVVPWLLVAMPLLLLALRRIVMAVTSLLLPGLGWLPGHFAKGFFPRARPPHSLDPVVIYNDNASFPSGHTGFATSITIFILFALTMWGVRRWWAVVLGVLFIVIVGLSRLYAAAHFPMDVLGGAVLASGTSIALWPLAAWWWGRGQAGGGRLAEPPYRHALTAGKGDSTAASERAIGADTTE
ncbi:undecaprenyl-diphosphatase [Raineyella antarctica]|uniref:Undecaprenyl-diphosphatase n=2 Tax=Raineyella antarctica TaxID=1577474 RepID=A0A1G6GLL5_9ACTN|nr:undecaprenyl-diphosphatase [Raineyella antarctica]